MTSCSLPNNLNTNTQLLTQTKLVVTPAVQQVRTTSIFTTMTRSLGATSTIIGVPLFSSTITLPLGQTQTISPTPICNRALTGSPFDITIPDDTAMLPGQSFSKTWRLKNGGSCTWTSQYEVIFFSGDLLGASQINYLGDTVQPGNSIDIILDMVAPNDPGIYQSNWELSDAQGKPFGIGPVGNAPFWVRIIVVTPNTSTPTFIPTETQTPTPKVSVSGLVNLKPNDAIDLDTDQINTVKNDDLLYSLDNDKTHVLTPQYSARMNMFGENLPTYSDCLTADLKSTPITLDSLNQGTYFCYLTNLGYPGWARLLALNTQDDTLTLEILTWTIP